MLLRVYEEVNAENAEKLRPILDAADVVFIHDPQPAPLLASLPGAPGQVDLALPHRPAATRTDRSGRYLRRFVRGYDASIFSLDAFAQPMPHPVFLIPPSIDPLSEKNLPLPPDEVRSVLWRSSASTRTGPSILQVSRFDRFKDPLGVIQAYQLAKQFVPSLQLVLAGGGAADDPEGDAVLAEVREAAEGDPDIHVLSSGHYSDRTINALQRAPTSCCRSRSGRASA